MTIRPQPAVLVPPAAHGRSVVLRRLHGVDPAAALGTLARGFDPADGLFGIGDPLVHALGRSIAGLRPFPALAGTPHPIPSTQGDAWAFLRGADRSAVWDAGERLTARIDGAFAVADATDTFLYAGGRDLTGYRDGSANPPPEEWRQVAIAAPDGATPHSSFVAVQRWSHDLAAFRTHAPDVRDEMIGRRIADDEEIDDAPETAHVKRTAQETFVPTGYMLRRSQAYANGADRGLEFVAHVAELDTFERMLRHMAGLDDGIVDALFAFSRPVTGGYYWCPPVDDDGLDLSLLGL